MSNYNVDNLVTVRALIGMHPDQHDQSNFSSNHYSNPIDNCGTTACVAGWTIAMQGMTLAEAYTHQDTMFDGMSISAIAGDILGLSFEEATDLFFNTLDEEDPEAAALAMLDEFIEKGKAQG